MSAGARRIDIVLGRKVVLGRRLTAGFQGRCAYLGRDWRVRIWEWGDADSIRRDSDGAVVLGNRALVAELHRRGLPVVHISAEADRNFPANVCSDNEAIGRAGAAHLLTTESRAFAFLGGYARFSDEREAGYRAALAEAGHRCATERIHGGLGASGFGRFDAVTQERLGAWLRSCEGPLAIMTATDGLAAGILETCREVGLLVPEEVAILGVDNDLLCACTDPPLASVSEDLEEKGRMSMAFLERLMTGDAEGGLCASVPPREVVARRSTERVRLDPLVAEARRRIAERACEGSSLAEILADLPVSRRWLERLFCRQVGHSPGEELRNRRLEYARHLLADGDDAILSIALDTGFASHAHFSRCFQQRYGVSPSAYRQRLAG